MVLKADERQRRSQTRHGWENFPSHRSVYEQSRRCDHGGVAIDHMVPDRWVGVEEPLPLPPLPKLARLEVELLGMGIWGITVVPRTAGEPLAVMIDMCTG